MKSSVKSNTRSTSKTSLVRRKSAGPLSQFARSTKRYGKQTLRDILLSKTFHSGFKVLIGLLVSGSALYGAYAFIGTTIANDVVVSQSEIIARISKHTELPEGDPEAIVRVQDPETLQKQAALYENVKEGDYIVIYPTVAVVYDLRNDHIVALKSTRR
ncbi:MAG: hypothetical protein ACAH17_01320 [Candidatus Paceibacterota bacterium]